MSLSNFTYINAPHTNKLKKYHEWSIWSQDSKRSKKLTEYTKELCFKIDNLLTFSPCILNNILHVTEHVMLKIQEYYGIKRGKVKNGIIAICIYYTYKELKIDISYNKISQSLDLPMKFITSAEKLILELINTHKLNLNKELLITNRTATEYIINLTKIKLPDIVVHETIKLIKICEENDILLAHSPLAIGVTCLYYIIQKLDFDISIKQLSEIYNISIMTINKTYNKLIIYDNFIKNILIK